MRTAVSALAGCLGPLRPCGPYTCALQEDVGPEDVVVRKVERALKGAVCPIQPPTHVLQGGS